MSERADQARAEQTRLTQTIFKELVELVDATIPDQLIAVTIDDRRAAARRPETQSRDYNGDDRVLELLVTRIVAELDAADLCLFVLQEGSSWLLARPLDSGHDWARRQGQPASTLEHQLRATIQVQLMHALRVHLRDRAAEFMPAQGETRSAG